MRAAFVGSGNLHAVEFASGSPFFMRRALERHFETALVVDTPWPRWFMLANGVGVGTSGGRFHADWSPRVTALAGGRTLARLQAAKPDIVFALLASPLAHILVDTFRVVHVSDTTFRAMFGYYDSFDKFSAATRRGGEIIEATVLRGAFLAVFASEWARLSAIRDYGVPHRRTRVIAMGANLDPMEMAPRSSLSREVRLLFNGVSWRRKGGQIALDTVAELTRRGIACRLDIVGCNADVVHGKTPPNVAFHGFVSKATPDGRKLLDRLYRDATLFLLPTRAECFGLVLCEAAHYGIPAIATDTGGIAELIKDGVTGLLVAPEAPAAAFADAIATIVMSPERYAAMSHAALVEAASRLNWDVWAEKVAEAVAQCVAEGA